MENTGIVVDLSDPPPWVVHVSFYEDVEGGREIPVTWPFATEEEARAAYSLAARSGRFVRVLKPGSKTRPAIAVNMVSLWFASMTETIHGEPRLSYRMKRMADAEDALPEQGKGEDSGQA